MSLSDPERQRLAELERLWNEKFIQQPKLPTSALLTGAVSMAMACGAGLFLFSNWLRKYAWIWIVLSVLFGLTNRYFAWHWYNHVVIPWDTERKATYAEMTELRRRADADGAPAA